MIVWTERGILALLLFALGGLGGTALGIALASIGGVLLIMFAVQAVTG